MKLGVSYIVFDGAELLESSIDQIREHVDFIQVIYQNRSWFGTPAKSDDIALMQKLKRSGKIDALTLFDQFIPMTSKGNREVVTAKDYERKKRQFGLDSVISNGCTHYLCMDVDEFYVSSQFKAAKDSIIQNSIDLSSVRFINYVNIPTLHRGTDAAHVPFICKITSVSKMGRGFFVKCDVTRGMTTSGRKTHSFGSNIIMMHHMETVRKDLKLKYDATTRSIFKRDKTNELISNIRSVTNKTLSFGFNKIIFPGTPSATLHEVENIFNIPYEKWNIQK
jgi:hypothetical protein